MPKAFRPPENKVCAESPKESDDKQPVTHTRRFLPEDYSELPPDREAKVRSAEAAQAVGAGGYSVLREQPQTGPTIGEVQRQLPTVEEMKNVVKYKGPAKEKSVLKQAATNTELQKAVERGDAEMVGAILRFGMAKRCVNVNAPLYPKRERLLHLASRKGFRDVCVLLLEAKAELDAEEITDGKHALHEACRYGQYDVCELLLDRKARLEEANFTGLRPLHWAATGGHVEVCDFLLDRKASVHAASSDMREPLHHATQAGHPAVVRLLCKRGAKADAELGGSGSGGQRPLQMACMVGHAQVAAALLDLGALGSLDDFGPDGTLRRYQGSEIEDVVRRVEQLRFQLDEAEELADTGQEEESKEMFEAVVAAFEELGLENSAASARADAVRCGVGSA